MTPEEIRRQKMIEDVSNSSNPDSDFVPPVQPLYEPRKDINPSGTMELDPYTEVSRDPSSLKDDMMKSMDQRDIYRKMLSGKLTGRSIDSVTAHPYEKLSRNDVLAMGPVYKALSDEKIIPITEQIDMMKPTSVDKLPSSDENINNMKLRMFMEDLKKGQILS